MVRKRIHSPSSILAYKFGEGFRWGCPRKYYLRYVKRLKPKPKPVLIVGRLVHATIEQLTRGFREEMLDWDYADLRALALEGLQELWDLKRAELSAACKTELECSGFFHDSQVMVLNWLHQFVRDFVAGKGLPLAETRIVNERLGVQGVIDALFTGDGQVEVLDYKIGSSDEMTSEIRLQLAIYSLLYKGKYGKLPDWVGVHFLRFPSGEKNPLRFKPTQGLVDYAAEEVELIHELTVSDKESDYPCKCGGWCEREFK